MNLNIFKARKKHLDPCVNALVNSDLGRVYFPEVEKARTALLEGLGKRELSVALDEADQFIGFYWLIPRGAFHSFPYLHIIAIKEEYRGKGYGKEIMQSIEVQVFGENSKIFLVVADFNPRAKKFYENAGYQEVGVIPDLYQAGATEYLMMKIKK
jgi:ribosomal protein S18 acetylase RimI-like enzyme